MQRTESNRGSRRFAQRRSPSGARGVAALAVTLLLFFALLLGVVFVHRNIVFEQRASANQYRSTQAFEAAEAGLAWAIAQLGTNRRIDSACLPTDDAGATSFRERYLNYVASSAGFTPATWSDAGVAQALQPTCVRAPGGWICGCPSAGRATLIAPGTDVPAPAFTIKFEAIAKPGLVRAVATGCTSLGGACAGDGGTATDASARVETLIGLLPALRTAPAAALTVRGAVDADAAAFGVHNRDAESGGLAIQAGGAVNTGHAHLTGPAGSSGAALIARDDAALAGVGAGRLFASYFGLDKNAWARQPVVKRLGCNGSCGAALLALIETESTAALIHVDGDLQIDGPAALGSTQRPVVVVVAGNVRLNGPVAVVGVLYAASVTWGGGAVPGALLRGALLSEGDYRGDATPEIVYDTEVLARLKGSAGTFARVNGSWKDF
ncbi:MAG: PilX N-terminal domain-containing pilus assembly protein [Caldimonas sp.]